MFKRYNQNSILTRNKDEEEDYSLFNELYEKTFLNDNSSSSNNVIDDGSISSQLDKLAIKEDDFDDVFKSMYEDAKHETLKQKDYASLPINNVMKNKLLSPKKDNISSNNVSNVNVENNTSSNIGNKEFNLTEDRQKELQAKLDEINKLPKNKQQKALKQLLKDNPDLHNAYTDEVNKVSSEAGGKALDKFKGYDYVSDVLGTIVGGVNDAKYAIDRNIENFIEKNDDKGFLRNAGAEVVKGGVNMVNAFDKLYTKALYGAAGRDMSENEKADMNRDYFDKTKETHDKIKSQTNEFSTIDENSGFVEKVLKSTVSSAAQLAVGTALGDPIMFFGLSSAGNAIDEAEERGVENAVLYGNIIGAIEAAAEKWLGSEAMKRVMNKAGFKSVIEAFNEVGEQGIKGIVIEALKEGGQEFATELMQQGAGKFFKDANGVDMSPQTMGESIENLAVAFSSGAVMGGGTHAVYNGITNINNKNSNYTNNSQNSDLKGFLKSEEELQNFRNKTNNTDASSKLLAPKMAQELNNALGFEAITEEDLVDNNTNINETQNTPENTAQNIQEANTLENNQNAKEQGKNAIEEGVNTPVINENAPFLSKTIENGKEVYITEEGNTVNAKLAEMVAENQGIPVETLTQFSAEDSAMIENKAKADMVIENIDKSIQENGPKETIKAIETDLKNGSLSEEAYNTAIEYVEAQTNSTQNNTNQQELTQANITEANITEANIKTIDKVLAPKNKKNTTSTKNYNIDNNVGQKGSISGKVRIDNTTPKYNIPKEATEGAFKLNKTALKSLSNEGYETLYRLVKDKAIDSVEVYSNNGNNIYKAEVDGNTYYISENGISNTLPDGYSLNQTVKGNLSSLSPIREYSYAKALAEISSKQTKLFDDLKKIYTEELDTPYREKLVNNTILKHKNNGLSEMDIDRAKSKAIKEANNELKNNPKTISKEQQILNDIMTTEDFKRSFKDLKLEVVDANNISLEQQTAYDLAKALGRDVMFYTAKGSQSNYAPNGFFTKNIIFINDKYNGDVLMSVLGHETFHSLENTHPELFNELIDWGVENFSAKEINKFLSKIPYQEEVQYLRENPRLLSEEMLAESFGTDFSNKDFWSSLEKTNKNLFDKIKELIAKILKKAENSTNDFLTKKHIKELRAEFEKVLGNLTGITTENTDKADTSSIITDINHKDFDFDKAFKGSEEFRNEYLKETVERVKNSGWGIPKMLGNTPMIKDGITYDFSKGFNFDAIYDNLATKEKKALSKKSNYFFKGQTFKEVIEQSIFSRDIKLDETPIYKESGFLLADREIVGVKYTLKDDGGHKTTIPTEAGEYYKKLYDKAIQHFEKTVDDIVNPKSKTDTSSVDNNVRQKLEEFTKTYMNEYIDKLGKPKQYDIEESIRGIVEEYNEKYGLDYKEGESIVNKVLNDMGIPSLDLSYLYDYEGYAERQYLKEQEEAKIEAELEAEEKTEDVKNDTFSVKEVNDNAKALTDYINRDLKYIQNVIEGLNKKLEKAKTDRIIEKIQDGLLFQQGQMNAHQGILNKLNKLSKDATIEEYNDLLALTDYSRFMVDTEINVDNVLDNLKEKGLNKEFLYYTQKAIEKAKKSSIESDKTFLKEIDSFSRKDIKVGKNKKLSHFYGDYSFIRQIIENEAFSAKIGLYGSKSEEAYKKAYKKAEKDILQTYTESMIEDFDSIAKDNFKKEIENNKNNPVINDKSYMDIYESYIRLKTPFEYDEHTGYGLPAVLRQDSKNQLENFVKSLGSKFDVKNVIDRSNYTEYVVEATINKKDVVFEASQASSSKELELEVKDKNGNRILNNYKDSLLDIVNTINKFAKTEAEVKQKENFEEKVKKVKEKKAENSKTEAKTKEKVLAPKSKYEGKSVLTSVDSGVVGRYIHDFERLTKLSDYKFLNDTISELKKVSEDVKVELENIKEGKKGLKLKEKRAFEEAKIKELETKYGITELLDNAYKQLADTIPDKAKLEKSLNGLIEASKKDGSIKKEFSKYIEDIADIYGFEVRGVVEKKPNPKGFGLDKFYNYSAEIYNPKTDKGFEVRTNFADGISYLSIDGQIYGTSVGDSSLDTNKSLFEVSKKIQGEEIRNKLLAPKKKADDDVKFSTRSQQEIDKIKEPLLRVFEQTTSTQLRAAIKANQGVDISEDIALKAIFKEAINVMSENTESFEVNKEAFSEVLVDAGVFYEEADAISHYMTNIIDEAKQKAHDSVPQSVNNIVSSSKKAKKSAKKVAQDVVSESYIKLVDDKAYAKKISDDLYTKARTSTTSFGTINSIFTEALTDKNGNKIGKSVEQLFKDVLYKNKNEETGLYDTKEFMEYALHKNNIARSMLDKALFFKAGVENDIPFTPIESAKKVIEFEEKHPDFKERQEELTSWLNKFFQTWAVDTGLVSMQTNTLFRQLYSSYITANRSFDAGEIIYSSNYGGKGFVDKTSPSKKARKGGSSRDIVDIQENIVNLITRTVRTAKMNEVGQTFLEAVRTNGDLKEYAELTHYSDEIAKDQKIPHNVVRILEDGKGVYIEVKDKQLLDMLESVHSPEFNDIENFSRKVLNGAKQLITTKNPFFAIRNTCRDLPTYLINSTEKSAIKRFKNLGKAIKLVAQDAKGQDMTNTELALYRAMGIEGSHRSSKETHKTVENLTQRKAAYNKQGELIGYKDIFIIKKGLSKIGDILEIITGSSETTFRLAEFIGAVERGESLEDATLKAMEITTDFSRGGAITKHLDSYVMYLNAGVQGLDRFGRQLINKPMSSLTRALMYTAVPALLFAGLNGDDDEYKMLDDRTKDNNYLIPLYLFGGEEGQYIKIPKAREYGIVAAFTERLIMGRGFDGFLDNAKSNILPPNPLKDNVLSNIAKYDDKDAKNYAGNYIIPRAIRDKKDPKEQYDENTTVLAKKLGEISGISPKMLDYYMDQYTGVIGDFIMPLLTPSTFASTDTKAKVFASIKSQFVADNAKSSSATNVYYDNLDMLSELKEKEQDGLTTAEKKKYTGQAEAISKYINEKYGEDITEFNKTLREDTTLTEEEKRRIQRARNEAMRRANNEINLFLSPKK